MKMSPRSQPECVAPTVSNVLVWPLFTWPALTLSHSWNVEHYPSFRTEHRALASAPPSLKPGGAPLFAIRVCLLLVVPFSFFSSSVTVWAILEAFQCWWRKQGAISSPHMWLQLRKRKGPQSRGPLWLAALFEIPPSRCYTNWTHFQLLKERRKWGANLPAATLQPFFKWSTIRLSLCFAVSLMIRDSHCKYPWLIGSDILTFDPFMNSSEVVSQQSSVQWRKHLISTFVEFHSSNLI